MQQIDQDIKTALQTNVNYAFELLYEHYFVDLCVYALRFFDNRDDAQDLVQQTMICLWERHDKLQKAEYIRTYIFHCVHNASLNQIRSKKHQPKSEAAVFLQDLRWEFTDEMVSKEQCEEIESAIQQLPKQCRTVLEMSRMQGLSYKEIAEQLQISYRTVDNHLTTATRLLHQKLKGIVSVGVLELVLVLIMKR